MVMMGLDIGDVRIGVAFTDRLLFAAHPYGVIAWGGFGGDQRDIPARP